MSKRNPRIPPVVAPKTPPPHAIAEEAIAKLYDAATALKPPRGPDIDVALATIRHVQELLKVLTY